MSDRYADGMKIRRRVLGDAHVDAAEASKSDFDKVFQDLITEGAYGQPPVRTVHEAPLLYHLGEDPAEQFDIAAREPEMVERILAEIDRHRDEVPVAEPLFDRRLE